MAETFASMLAVGGKLNTLGRAAEVVQIVLDDQSRLDELFDCIFHEDAWLRMRAIDSFEKVCRVHPDWIVPYVDRLLTDVAAIDQASIHWHLAEIFAQVELTPRQRRLAINLMTRNISTNQADWIVASNTMKTLADYVQAGHIENVDLIPLLEIQQTHHSAAVIKRATKLLDQITK